MARSCQSCWGGLDIQLRQAIDMEQEEDDGDQHIASYGANNGENTVSITSAQRE